MSIRVIARLDVKGPNLVKGIQMEGLRVLGKPERFARHYYEQGADELLYMDLVASLYQRNNLLEIVTRTANETFIPLTVGGGLRSLADIYTVLRAGADKVSLNTAAINRPQFIQEAARQFGSSTIVISIEAIRQPDGSYQAFTDNGRESTGVDVFKWAVESAELGAGELLVTSVDREGTGKGYDLELTRRIAESVTIPVIACGGAGKVSQIHEVVTEGKADAVCLASLLHYDCVDNQSQNDDFSGEGNTEFLRNGRRSANIHPAGLPVIKEYLADQGIPCRPAVSQGIYA